jgi:hypothetical protein
MTDLPGLPSFSGGVAMVTGGEWWKAEEWRVR